MARNGGSKGGLKQYAEQIGKSRPYISQLVAAAEVLKATKDVSQLTGLIDRSQHLYAIHALPSELWHAMVEALVKNEWSLADTERQVKEGKPVGSRADDETDMDACVLRSTFPASGKWLLGEVADRSH